MTRKSWCVGEKGGHRDRSEEAELAVEVEVPVVAVEVVVVHIHHTLVDFASDVVAVAVAFAVQVVDLPS